ncbi:DUF397 domain-containing protein [Lentzea sp. BCCO 10_0798]|nr:MULTISPECIES: DUF397 domain-containing protein [unclassified Lentzea]MDX8051130.1 DUF397 domain-containing protein [Lentzea sp. BCCO 10_0798]
MRNNRGRCWRTTSADRERNSMSEARAWRKSSYSGATEDDNCVEVSLSSDALVRDSKNPSGGVLTFTSAAWKNFLENR